MDHVRPVTVSTAAVVLMSNVACREIIHEMLLLNRTGVQTIAETLYKITTN